MVRTPLAHRWPPGQPVRWRSSWGSALNRPTSALLAVLVSLSAATASAAVRDGSLQSGVDLKYQYAPVSPDDGYVRANWDKVRGADGYRVSVGTSRGASDVFGPADVGNVRSYEARGLSLQGAAAGVTYFVTVEPVPAVAAARSSLA